MTRARVAVLALVAIACRPDGGARPPSHVAAPPVATPTTTPVVPVADDTAPALGPAEPEPPVDATKRSEFHFVERGPARPIGARARLQRRPNAPGRGGELLVAIDSPYQLFGRASSYVHVAAWRKDGRPAAHADVFVGRRGVGRTDEHGTLVFRHRGADGTTGDHALDTNDLFVVSGQRCGVVGFTPYSRTAGFASDQLYVYTDRGVYRQGETVNVRVIGWHLAADYAPIEGGEVELLLRDHSGHSLAAAKPKTDEFGTASAELKVPLSTAEDTYTLQVSYGRARETTDLQIRAFEPPALRIEHTLPRMIGPDRKEIAFTVAAHPVGGGALRGAKIRVEVTGAKGRTDAIERDVDGAGPHAFTFGGKRLAKLRAGAADGESLRFVVRVTDQHGREDTLQRHVKLASNPWVGVLEADRDAYAPGEPVVVIARVSDLDDVALRGGELTLEGVPGKPLTARTDDHGLARFEFAMPATGANLELFAPDVVEAIATSNLSVGAVAPMQGTLADPIVRERTSTAIAVRFPQGHVPVDRRVHMDLIDTSGALVVATVLRAAREGDGFVARGEIEVPTWGSAMLTLFALGRAPKQENTEGGGIGLLVAGQELAVVPDRTLEIELSGLPETATPGATLDVRASVRDRSGRPVRFAASAALVDSTVLALKDPLEVTPMDRFYDPDLRTLATTGADMLTWPVVSRNWGAPTHDVALPPFPWLGGGEVDSCRNAWDEQDFAALDPHEAASLMGIGGGGGGMGLGSVGLIGAGTMGRGEPSITIRTRFPDTSLWLPNLRGDGETEFKAQLSDRIGEQELVVVASDREGGVGIARERVTVTQPVFVEADLPDFAVAGERLEIPVVVHNRTDADAGFALALTTANGKSGRADVRVPTAGSEAALLPLSPKEPGVVAVTIEAKGAGTIDRAIEDVTVVPAGVTVPGIVQPATIGSRSLELVVEVPDSASRLDAHLRIAMPAVTSSMLPLDELLTTIGDDPYRLASDLASAAVLLRLADRHRLATPAIDRLRSDARAAVAMIARVQRDGAFAYWRNGKRSLYITALVLDGLLAAKDAGLPAPADSIRAAADVVGKALAGGDPLPIAEIGWWEGDDTRVREGLTAEAFVVLARVPKDLRTSSVDKALVVLERRFAPTLASSDADVRTTAHALTALLLLGKIDRNDARSVIERLVALRDHGHWEPTWFSAYGGTLEATTAVLDAMHAFGAADFAVETRDAVRWLLSTSGTWGEWHNERGTAAALRTIATLADLPSASTAKEIEVFVDGKRVQQIEIDAKDPLGSVLALGRLDVGKWTKGRHVVELRWDRGPAPVANLITRTWQTARGPESRRTGASLRADAPAKGRVGDALALELELRGKRLGGATIRLARSGLVELDMVRLGASIGRGRAISDVVVREDAIELRLGPDVRARTLSLPYRAVRRGEGRWPTVALAPRPHAATPTAPIVVDAGALVVH